jgi:hypothetical protein
MTKRYMTTLTEDERAGLSQRVATGRGPARELTRARILLKADRGPDGPAWADASIAAALDVSVPTIEGVRRRFVRAAWTRLSRSFGLGASTGRGWTASRRPTSWYWRARRRRWVVAAGR